MENLEQSAVAIREIEDRRLDEAQTPEERARKRGLVELFRECPIPENEVLNHLSLFINRQQLTRILFMHELYQQIVDVHGVVAEFGVRWGQNLALFESLRGIYEPYNHTRKIVGFDTFEGFASLSDKDGQGDIITEGAYSVTPGYEEYLSRVLDYHEQESPVSHIRKYRLVKGDATRTVREYLDRHPETIIAFAYFDFDLYEPTRACLEAIRPHVTRGTVIGFDQLSAAEFPGETAALKEVFGLDRVRIRRWSRHSAPSYIVIE